MAYVDGVMVAVKTAEKAAFTELAKNAARIFKDHGATQVMDCWGDSVPDGEVTSMPMAVQKSADDTVVFSWIVWPSKEVRDAGFEAAMKDPRFDMEGFGKVSNMKTMVFGGFTPLYEFD